VVREPDVKDRDPGAQHARDLEPLGKAVAGILVDLRVPAAEVEIDIGEVAGDRHPAVLRQIPTQVLELAKGTSRLKSVSESMRSSP